MSSRFGMRLCAASFSLALIGLASGASAHVSVSSDDAKPGGFGKLVFRVPSESDTASTNKVTITLPAKTPFAFVSSLSKPGWTAKLNETRHDKPVKIGDFAVSKTVTSVTWTSTGEGISPGEFDEFALSVGPIPKAKSLNFSVQQGYSDNSAVDWDQIQTGKTEPERPAPTLQLNALAPRTEKASTGSANGLVAAALVLAAAGVVLGLRNTRRHV